MIGLRATRTMLAAAALLCTPAHAAEESAVREMMVASGLVEQLGDIDEEYHAGILQLAEKQGQMGLQFAQELADIAARVMEGERFLADLEAHLVETVSSGDAEAVTAFYRSDFGERVRQAEVSASVTSARLELENMRAELRAELEKSPERLALFRQIDEALFASELMATAAVSLLQAMALGLAQGQPDGVDPALIAALKDRIAAAHDQIVEQMRERLLTTFAFTYGDLSDSDLEEYVEFLRTDAARATNAAMFEAVHIILSGRGEEMGEALGELIRQKRT